MVKGKTLAISALLLGAISQPAAAEDDGWVHFAKGSAGANFWIHTQKYKKVGPQRIKVWTREMLPKPASIYVTKDTGPMYSYSVAQQEVDCAAETSATLSITFHKKDGSVVATNNAPGTQAPSAPDTIGELLIASACSLLSN